MFRSLRPNHLKTNTLSHPDIRTIKELQNGNIWFGSFVNGIDVVDPKYGVIRGFRPDPSDDLALQSGYVFSIEQMPDGDIWVSTFGQGIFKYLPEKDGFKQFVDVPELADNTVRTLKSDGTDWLWVGTDAGLSLMNTKTETLTRLTMFGPRKTVFDKVIEAIHVYGGYAWIATNQGLYIADKNTKTLVPVVSPPATALSDNFITDIHITVDGEMYIANSLGLERLRKWDASGVSRGQVLAEFESISAKLGMRGSGLGGTILEDDTGRLWVQNSVIDTKNWTLSRINKSSGWDVGNLWIGSNEKLKDGTLLFGANRGVLVIRPELYE